MSESNPYLGLTRQFNHGRIRSIICSGQAVVLHGLAVMSKDGDWILKEDDESLRHILQVLDQHGARYRFGAPLALPWMRMGWSSHLEIGSPGDVRIRTDFFTRPPRIGLEDLESMWNKVERQQPEYPVTDLLNLARLKLTNRERDYAVIGEIARKMPEPKQQLLWSRSARDLISLAGEHAELAGSLVSERSLLVIALSADRDALEVALDQERRQRMRDNERRLEAMQSLLTDWKQAWPDLLKSIQSLSLLDAHSKIVEAARNLLPSS